ncbi:hypothetical protein GQ55_9G364900 [Panicum hallii var. hallii]|uniref:Uncharacterized protein n=1 Tax=Panicum hallii var. hallii TaxID=1504633 RepID=A0A2T7C8U1_9POAL|nr:hypothetical protein GQ55_9G364900 [Panicum hallii var. hallii]
MEARVDEGGVGDDAYSVEEVLDGPPGVVGDLVDGRALCHCPVNPSGIGCVSMSVD